MNNSVDTVENNYIREFVRIFFANRKLIRRIFVGFAIFTLLVSLLPQKWWELSGQVIVLSKKLSQSTETESMYGTPAARYLPPELQDLETESNILRSQELIRKTVSELHASGEFYLQPGLIDTWVLEPVKTAIAPIKDQITSTINDLFDKEPEEEKDSTIDELSEFVSEELTTEILPGSNVILITFKFTDPDMGVMFLNKHLDNYLEKRRELLLDEANIDFFLDKKNRFQARFEELEREKTKLLNDYGATDPDRELTLTMDQLFDEKNKRNLLRDLIPEKRKTQELRVLKAQISIIDERLELLNKRVSELNEVESRLVRLSTEIDAVREAYFTYSRKYEDIRTQENENARIVSNVKVLEHATPPLKPAFPRPKLMIPLGLVTGLLLALSLGYIREFFDHGFKHQDQIIKYLDIPVIATINDNDLNKS
ncbi:GumC family protein [Alkalimarinus coralli]|uniref:GumC family protein n=1 Tax=Alkalimarinus coralli TaxID=2935863 RepID=UPI00202B3485|nr:Wzz/FepE/Etk N-terminal domain-containing protein [Alkalimarinus coralli]